LPLPKGSAPTAPLCLRGAIIASRNPSFGHCECPLWVISGHWACTIRDVRFTPRSGHGVGINEVLTSERALAIGVPVDESHRITAIQTQLLRWIARQRDAVEARMGFTRMLLTMCLLASLSGSCYLR
jgi:hypothetical protein